jgi:hypothetical protein
MAEVFSLPALRLKAAKVEMLSLDELKFFVEKTRVSYTAAAEAAPEKKDTPVKLSRDKKPAPPQDVDFF